MKAPGNERGAALLAILALVMLLGSFATLGLQRLRTASDRVSALDSSFEASLVAQSATALVLAQAGSGRTARQPAGSRGDFTIGDASIHFELADAGNCFNLNSLAPAEGSGTFSRNNQPAQASQQNFASLLTAAGLPPLDAGTLARNAAAMLQANDILWADASEWLATAGLRPADRARLQPLLCTLPNREAAALNLNSLRRDQAPLLTAAGLDADEARLALASRPANGWASPGDFWRQASAGGIPQTAAARVAGTSSRWLVLQLTIVTGRTSIHRRLLIDARRQPAVVEGSIWGGPTTGDEAA